MLNDKTEVDETIISFWKEQTLKKKVQCEDWVIKLNGRLSY